MGVEIDLMENYPRTKRNLDERLQEKTEQDRLVARRFGREFFEVIPGLEVAGIDISEYAISNAVEGAEAVVQVADARELPFEDDSFDLVVSINTLHNFQRDGVIQSLREVQRVSRQWSFVVLDAYRDEEERRRIEAWNLTALTVLSTDEWKGLFAEAGYDGDFFWFIP